MNQLTRVSLNMKLRTQVVCQETSFDLIKTSLLAALGSIHLSHSVSSVITDQNLKVEHDTSSRFNSIQTSLFVLSTTVSF